MRPILLKIAGLQSYRDAQEVDFTKLTDAGVFGIFGPTGSGKSTILDAITLALYGKVERASGGTQAIMNHSENSLSVSFAFELASASGAKRYRVERQFKRSGDVSIQNAVSRFVEVVPEGDRVITDKMSDTTRAVEDLLGLSMQDFTRAVVLPQGKFAEFLTLAGKDRRAMLQRLFHLEQYGDGLSSRLSARYKETDVAIKEIAAEQQGLGDASAEAVEAAAERLAAARREAERAREALAASELRYAEAKQIRERQQERDVLAKQLERLTERDEQIRSRERQLAQSESAAKALPYLRELEAARESMQTCRAALEAAQANLAAAAEQAERATAAYEQAQGELTRGEAPLLLRLEQLEQAKLLQADETKLAAEMRQMAEQRDGIAGLMRQAQEQGGKEKEKLEKAVKRQTELRDELKGNEVRTEDRERLQSALGLKQSIDSLRARLQEQELEQEAKQAAFVQLQQSLAETGERRHSLDGQLQALAEQTADELLRLTICEAELRELQQAIPLRLEWLRHAEQAAEAERLAHRLAAHLQDGEACPVCGSCHHPRPAGGMPELEGIDGRHAESMQLEQLQQKIGSKLLDLKQHLFRGDRLLRSIGEREAGDSEEQLDFLQEAAPAAAVSSVASEHEHIVQLEVAAARLNEADKQIDHIGGKIVAIERELNTISKHEIELTRQVHQLTANEQAAKSAFDGLASKQAAIKAELLSLEGQWDEQYPALQRDQVAAATEQLAEKDRKAQDIRDRLDRSVPFIEQTKEQIAALERQLAEAEKTQAQLSAILQGKSELLEEKRLRLRQWIGEHSAERLIAEATAELAALREKHRLAAQEREMRLQTSQQASNGYSAAQQASSTATERLAKAEDDWRAVLQKTTFQDEAATKAALLDDETVQAWTKDITAHRDAEKRLHAQLGQLDELLHQRTLSEEQWDEVAAALSMNKQRDELALSERAKAERDAEELERKHVKWRELETRREVQHQLYERLGKLQSVFRGNAFVEFIAEEQLIQVSRAASERLGFLTKRRYAIEVDSGGGFVIRDDANGGVKRPVSTLSGGETFLASLALALALSTQIQLRGQYPLQFFFLDEGFGTLDPDLLDTVVTALERLHTDQLSVGVISHVPELRARLPRKLIVLPAEHSGRGSTVRVETL